MTEREERDLLLAVLYGVMHRLHPTHGNTAHHSGGIGGQMATPCCHVVLPDPGWEQAFALRADEVLGASLLSAEREGRDVAGLLASLGGEPGR